MPIIMDTERKIRDEILTAEDHDHVVVRSEPTSNPAYARPVIVDHFSKTVHADKKHRIVYTYAFGADSTDPRAIASTDESVIGANEA